MKIKLNKKHKSQKGFTLIELLVVISIISLLSSVGLYAYNSVRIKGRNTKRVSDLETISKALEMYYDDNGAYPLFAMQLFSADSNWSDLQFHLSSYINLPEDPINNSSLYYSYSTIHPPTGNYALFTVLEGEDNQCHILPSVSGLYCIER